MSDQPGLVTILHPLWLEPFRNDPHEFRRQKNRFVLRFATLFAGPNANMQTLSQAIEVPYSTLTSGYRLDHGVIAPALATKLSLLCKNAVQPARDILPASYIRPDIFKS